MKVVKCPEVHSRTNRAVVNGHDWDPVSAPHLEVVTSPGHSFIFSVVADASLNPGLYLVGFWGNVSWIPIENIFNFIKTWFLK